MSTYDHVSAQTAVDAVRIEGSTKHTARITERCACGATQQTTFDPQPTGGFRARSIKTDWTHSEAVI